MITHLEPDILECEVKWALGSITTNKTSRGDGFPADLLQILTDDAVKVLYQYARKFGKLSTGPQTGNGQFSFQSQRKAIPKNVQTASQCHSSQTLAKQCSKFCKLGFNRMWTESFQMFKLDLEEAEESEIKFPTSIGSLKKQENSRKTSTSALLTLPKPLIMWITTNCGTFLKKQEYQTTLPISWETYMQVMKQVRTEQGTMDWFKIGKGVCQGCMLSPVYLTYMQNISCRMPGWMSYKLESRLPWEITSDMQMIPL